MLFNRKLTNTVLTMAEAEKEMAQDDSIVVIDVRTLEEYREGHIPGSHNIPLNRLTDIKSFIQDPDTRLFVYCLSGARSAAAARLLERIGYTNATDIGGITKWRGRLEKSWEPDNTQIRTY